MNSQLVKVMIRTSIDPIIIIELFCDSNCRRQRELIDGGNPW